MFEVVRQTLGQKLLLFERCLAVGFYAEKQVVAEACPAVLLVVEVYQLAERRVLCRGFINDLAAQVVHDNVAGTCRAVVVEEVVAINHILGLRIAVDGL